MTKTTRIISIVLMVIPALVLVMSGCMKLAGAKELVDNMTKGGLGAYITLFGIIELVSVVLLFIPKTRNLGFLLICCYLGGAMSIELASGKPPTAAVFLALLWIGMFLQNKAMFLADQKNK